MKPFLRVIGDVHGSIHSYCKLAKKAEYSLQVGDLGFNYDAVTLDPAKHKFIPGNHDNYSLKYRLDLIPEDMRPSMPLTLRDEEVYEFYKMPEHFIGNYGKYNFGNLDFFYVRGAYSIDKNQRIIGISWWEDEELTYDYCGKAIELYKQTKPDIMITHDCPISLYPRVVPPEFCDKIFASKTAQMLEEMFSHHQPKLWLFGHHHNNQSFVVKNTHFVCLGIMSWIDLTEEGNIGGKRQALEFI